MAQTALICGGSGKVSRQLTKLLTSQNPPWTVYSLIRKSSQVAELEELGAKPIVQSIEDSSVSELASTIKNNNVDVVIWSAGAGGQGGPSRTDKVDRRGAIKSMDATAEAGVKRYIIVSAVDVRDRNKSVPSWYNEDDKSHSDKIWGGIGAYMAAKLAADTELRNGNSKRGLEYTIVRPGLLLDEPAAGKVDAGKVHLKNGISRADVAGVILESIKNKGTIGLAFDLVGGDTPVAEAVKKVAEEKADTFEGHF
ncbi:Rossmann-fold NAD(P)(+)-binding protein [Tothia fuscella]|uniref:Rossmann-fold NAD(P)(+)-binding protein n=1 Tax=Tothia fuscella TaxID=1048955 RepID=A0A9P4NNQ2_9PEZI|nr:Rossmann-fold NAD(P)(+)-binding protein [Tothia fuscella]